MKKAKERTERRKEEKKPEEPQPHPEPYRFTAYVNGPIYSFEISGRSVDEVYATGMRMLNKELDKYKGKVELNKIEVEKWPDIVW